MDALVADVASLVDDVECRADLGWGGRAYLDRNYSIRRLVERYEELFEDVL
jgi:hypothetical protein